MKLKYFMTIPLGYLILFFSQRFGLYEPGVICLFY